MASKSPSLLVLLVLLLLLSLLTRKPGQENAEQKQWWVKVHGNQKGQQGEVSEYLEQLWCHPEFARVAKFRTGS